jgi:hypothetical protein
MSNELRSWNIQCPYCGETIELLLDCSIEEQNYIEDCQVCCRPISLDITVGGDDSIVVRTLREDEY